MMVLAKIVMDGPTSANESTTEEAGLHIRVGACDAASDPLLQFASCQGSKRSSCSRHVVMFSFLPQDYASRYRTIHLHESLRGLRTRTFVRAITNKTLVEPQTITTFVSYPFQSLLAAIAGFLVLASSASSASSVSLNLFRQPSEE